jgi:hypothetical protein
LYNQTVLRKHTTIKQPPEEQTTQVVGEHILHNIPTKDIPHAQAILDIIKDNPEEIGWTNNGELVLDNITIANSNLINILLTAS